MGNSSFDIYSFIVTEPGVLPEAAFLFLQCRSKVVYILPSADTTLALLLVEFTEYDDDDGDDSFIVTS
ncbi:hypothetical protein Hanom_Chr13g01221701 [Helianthus anomalus]